MPAAVESDVSEKRITIALVLTLVTMVASVAGGLASHSLALLSDAGHMLADAGALGLATAYFPGDHDVLGLLPGHLLGVVRKDDPADAARLRGYWDGPVRRRAEQGSATWRTLWDLRTVLED